MDSKPDVDPRLASALLKDWKEELKIDVGELSRISGLAEATIRDLLAGTHAVEFDQLVRLARALNRSMRDMLPIELDLVDGVKILRHERARVFQQDRGGGLQYTYWARVTSSAIPDIVPVELLLHLSDPGRVVPNRGHFFHQYTEILDGGPVTVFWKDAEGRVHSYTGTEGDSWLIPGFTPHWFVSPHPDRLGKIIAVTIGQHLTGDARQELTLVGGDRVEASFDSTRNIGALLRAYRENRRFPLEMAAAGANVETWRLRRIEAGETRPDPEILMRLAEVYRVSLRDLMDQHDDLVHGVRILPQGDAVRIQLPYGERIARVASARLPNVTANELRLNGRVDPDFAAYPSHTYVQVLRGPDVVVEWQGRQGVRNFRATTGDTLLIAAYVSYRVRAVPGEDQGRVLELSMAQHLLNGDAFREALLIGPQNLRRITEPIEYYTTQSRPAVSPLGAAT